MKRGAPLILLLLALVVVYAGLQWKYGLLHLPYFWDELGVYARAAIHQAVHGLGILPSSMPDVLSRGHPMMVPFVFGTSFKLFGIKLSTARLTAWCIYLIGCGFTYRIIYGFSSSLYAALITLIIAVQPVFLAQSVLIFPELPLAVVTVIALFYYHKDRLAALIIALSVAVMIKESALILPIAFGLAYLIHPRKLRKALLTAGIPIAVFLGFLLLQKWQNGYYLYPLHQNLMDFSPEAIWVKLGRGLHFLFADQGRWLLFILLAGAIILALFQQGVKETLKSQQTLSRLAVPVLLLVLGGMAF